MVRESGYLPVTRSKPGLEPRREVRIISSLFSFMSQQKMIEGDLVTAITYKKATTK